MDHGLIQHGKIRDSHAPKFLCEQLGLSRKGYKEQALALIATNDDLKARLLDLLSNPFELDTA